MSHDHDDYQSEPIPGLPARPPEGEKILWQGSPDWWELAKHVFHIRSVAAYFLLLIGWRVGVRLQLSHDPHLAIMTAVGLLPMVALGLGLLALLATLCARTTVYTLTSRRVVMRVGVALPTAINIPFKVITAADLREGAGGVGDIPLVLAAKDKIPYATLWPHARPWRMSHPEPMLRGIKDAAQVAQQLATAWRAEAPPGTALVAKETARQDRTVPISASVGLSA